jgi:shikimate kinase
MNIILLGYRGCGKTSIGKKLASQMWKTYVDVDVETCKRFRDRTIAEIWREFGEPAWRQAEVAVTRELVGRKDQVIGLGGGTLMQPGAREAVEQAADTKRIYLKCSAEELYRRVQADTQSAATRPNLTNLGGGLDEIKAMLEKRGPVYEAVADVVFDVTHLKVDDGVRYLIQNCL